MIRILICIFTMDERQGWVNPSLAEFINDAARNQEYETLLAKAHGFIPVGAARNRFCRAGMASGADWLLMLDNDMAPKASLLDCVQGAPDDAAVIIPRYYMFDGTTQRTKLCWGLEGTSSDGFKAIGPGFHELTKGGTGAMFVRPQALAKVPEPWFFYSYGEDGIQTSTEDIEFCLKARAHGLKVYGNADHEVDHHHTVSLSAIARMQQALDEFRRKSASPA